MFLISKPIQQRNFQHRIVSYNQNILQYLEPKCEKIKLLAFL